MYTHHPRSYTIHVTQKKEGKKKGQEEAASILALMARVAAWVSSAGLPHLTVVNVTLVM
jgi:hypothetical protein